MNLFRMFQKRPEPVLRLQLTVIIEPDDDGSYHAYCPAFKGLHVDGQTEDVALENAGEAIQIYLHSLVKHGDPIPIGPHFTVEKPREEVFQVPVGGMS